MALRNELAGYSYYLEGRAEMELHLKLSAERAFQKMNERNLQRRPGHDRC